MTDVGENGRRDEPAIFELCRSVATCNESRFSLAFRDVAFDAGTVFLGGQRTDVGAAVQGRPDLQIVGHGGQGIDNFIIANGGSQKAGRERTGLTVIAKSGEAYTPNNRSQLRNVKNNSRRFTTRYQTAGANNT